MKHFIFLLLPLISTAQFGLKEQRFYVSDSLITNNTQLHLYSLFNSSDSVNKIVRFTEPLDGNVKVCGTKKMAIIYAGGISFQLQANGIFIDSLKCNKCKNGINSYFFGGSKRIKELNGGEVEITFDLDVKHIKSQIGTIEVSPQELQCDDTGTNPFNIFSEGKEIIFKQGGNLILFEFDSNNDDKMELYIANYFSCIKRFEMYKVEKR